MNILTEKNTTTVAVNGLSFSFPTSRGPGYKDAEAFLTLLKSRRVKGDDIDEVEELIESWSTSLESPTNISKVGMW